jgi:WD40 repeat protein
LINNNNLLEIKKAHSSDITNFRHYLDNIYKRDLIMSISGPDCNIKIWNVNNFELLLNIEEIYMDGLISSACFINYFNQNYILTSNSSEVTNIPESIYVFDFNGHKIKEINDSKDPTYFIDIYYHINFDKNYIITGNKCYIKVYDYKNNEIMLKYCDNSNNYHNSIIIDDKSLIIKIIESCEDGNIRIWNFYSGELLNKIKISNKRLYEICLWDNKYIFVGCEDNTIKLVELNNNLIINNLKGHNNIVLTVKKIIHPKYGECLLSQGYTDDKIILWSNKNQINNK